MVGEVIKKIHATPVIQTVIAEFFRAALVVGSIAMVLEVVRPGTVSYFVNPLIILLSVVGSALVTIGLVPPKANITTQKSDWWFLGVLALAAGWVIGWTLRDFGWLAWVLGPITAMMVAAIGMELDNEEEA